MDLGIVLRTASSVMDFKNNLDKSLKDRKYFFDKGIRFSCTQCGSCCTGEPGIIYITQEECDKIAEHLNISSKDFLQSHCYPFESAYSLKEHADGRCLFFENGCQIYDLRPSQCKTFPFWFKNLRSEHAWNQVCKDCPGIGKGKLFDRSMILNYLSK